MKILMIMNIDMTYYQNFLMLYIMEFFNFLSLKINIATKVKYIFDEGFYFVCLFISCLIIKNILNIPVRKLNL